MERQSEFKNFRLGAKPHKISNISMKYKYSKPGYLRHHWPVWLASWLLHWPPYFSCLSCPFSYSLGFPAVYLRRFLLVSPAPSSRLFWPLPLVCSSFCLSSLSWGSLPSLLQVWQLPQTRPHRHPQTLLLLHPLKNRIKIFADTFSKKFFLTFSALSNSARLIKGFAIC